MNIDQKAFDKAMATASRSEKNGFAGALVEAGSMALAYFEKTPFDIGGSEFVRNRAFVNSFGLHLWFSMDDYGVDKRGLAEGLAMEFIIADSICEVSFFTPRGAFTKPGPLVFDLQAVADEEALTAAEQLREGDGMSIFTFGTQLGIARSIIRHPASAEVTLALKHGLTISDERRRRRKTSVSPFSTKEVKEEIYDFKVVQMKE